MSPELSRFYKSVQAWIDSNFTVNPYDYVIHSGLCLNSCSFESKHELPMDEVYHEMICQFKEAGLNTDVPFNVYPRNSYNDESTRKTIWQNKERLAWVKDHAAN